MAGCTGAVASVGGLRRWQGGMVRRCGQYAGDLASAGLREKNGPKPSLRSFLGLLVHQQRNAGESRVQQIGCGAKRGTALIDDRLFGYVQAHTREPEEICFGSQNSLLFGVRQLKTLKVVLSEEIEGLGRAGQIVSVAPGYARNKLIPHHLALPALTKYVTLVNKQLKIARPHLLVEKEDVKSTETISVEEKFQEIETALRRLDAGKVVLRREVSSLNNLQRGVTKEEIIAEVKKQMGVELAASSVMLPMDLTILGEFEVLLRFPRDLALPGGKEKLYLKVRIRRK